MPISTANASSTTTMPASRASLSCEPKCAIANSLTGIGVRLIAVSPTAMTGALFGPMIAAASSATPSATAAVSTPVSAPASRRRTVACPVVVITGPIRNCRRSGLAWIKSVLVLTSVLLRGNPLARVPRMQVMNRPEIRERQPDPGAAEGERRDLGLLLAQAARGDHQAFEVVY